MDRLFAHGHRFAIALGMAFIVGVVVWAFRE